MSDVRRGDASIAETLRILTRPRMAGTPVEVDLRAFIARELEAVGCAVREEPFDYDPFWARRGFGFILALAALALLSGAFLPDPLLPTLVGFAIAVPVIFVAATGIPRVDRRSRLRVSNVIAAIDPERPPETPPDVVLMAHIDSKSQSMSFAARSACAALAAAALVGALLAAAAGAPEPMTRSLLVASALSVGALAMSGSGNASPGALDNATGVAAVMELVRRLRADLPAGLCIDAVVTTAEEDGLVGAHRFAESHADALRASIVINIDTIGPGDRLFLVLHGRRPEPSSPLGRACAAVQASARAEGVRLVPRRVPFPAGVDSHPIARHGIAALSLAAGGVRDTFRHLHRPSDTLERVDVSAVTRAVDVVERAVRALGP